MNKLDIKILYNCNNNCLFCIQGEEKRKKFGIKSLDEIKTILLKSYNENLTRQVIFTGGEPTLHPNLLDSIFYAKEIGYKLILVQSNGQNFSDLEFCLKLKKVGITHFCPSIHGFYPETHEFLTKTKGGWKKVIQGIKNIKKIGSKISINIVITKQNYKEIPNLSLLLCRLGVDYFQFAFPHIGGSAKINADIIIPKKTEIIPYIKRGLEIAKKYGITCLTEAIPYCIMKGYEEMVGEIYLPESTIYDAAYYIESFSDYRLNEGKIKREECKKCSKYIICEGPWKEYPEMYGWDEFIPY